VQRICERDVEINKHPQGALEPAKREGRTPNPTYNLGT